ncbi:MAG: hypothetical protein WKG03_10205, partial [Telluria sp.]
MFKHMLIAAITLFPALANAGAQLTDIETRWLKAAAPVLAYSQRINLPIDIIVQPQARPTDVPLAMGFMDGRCKLVLSMRGNPDAEKVLEHVPEGERGVLMEAMAAHEVGHCWRYVKGAWHALPAGFTEATGQHGAGDSATQAASAALRNNRREEGFADMVALAWIQRFHPERYQQVYAWLAAVRSDQPVAGAGHDTRVWV